MSERDRENEIIDETFVRNEHKFLRHTSTRLRRQKFNRNTQSSWHPVIAHRRNRNTIFQSRIANYEYVPKHHFFFSRRCVLFYAHLFGSLLFLLFVVADVAVHRSNAQFVSCASARWIANRAAKNEGKKTSIFSNVDKILNAKLDTDDVMNNGKNWVIRFYSQWVKLPLSTNALTNI